LIVVLVFGLGYFKIRKMDKFVDEIARIFSINTKNYYYRDENTLEILDECYELWMPLHLTL